MPAARPMLPPLPPQGASADELGTSLAALLEWLTEHRLAALLEAGLSARRRGEPGEDWLWKIIQRKKPKQATIALANRKARTAYALMKNQTEFRVANAA